MDSQTYTSLLLLIFSILCLGTGIYAFHIYSKTKNERLFAVGISMVVTAAGIICGALDEVHLLPFNLGWIWYAGTSAGFFLLFLSSIIASAEQYRLFKRWAIVIVVLLITILALTPILPAYPNPYVPLVLDICRTIICSLGFFRYLSLYTSQGTRFSLLMLLAFLFVTIGYAILVPQLLNPTLLGLTIIGAIIRILGVSVLFTAFVMG